MIERKVSDVLGEMSKYERDCVSLVCDYASGYLKTKTPEALEAARRIRDEFTEEQQKVAYYLIGCAQLDYKKPLILTFFN